MESTRITDEEQKRRQSLVMEGIRTFNRFDPFSWSYAGKCSALGFGILSVSMTYYMLWYRKPWYAALTWKMGVFGIGVGSTYFIARSRARVMADRDAVVEHYIQLHPEDFDRITNFRGRPYRDILLPWVPIRPQYTKSEEEKE